MRKRKTTAWVIVLMFFLQSTLGMLAGILVMPEKVFASTYYAGTTVKLDDLKVNDIVEYGTVLMTAENKSVCKVRLDNKYSCIETKKNTKLSLNKYFKNVNMIVKSIIDTGTILSVEFETYTGRLDVILNDDFQELVKTQMNIKLDDFAIVDKSIIINDGKTHIIDLNGYGIERSSLPETNYKGNVIRVEKASTLIIKDTSSAKDGTISGGNANCGGGIYVDDSSKFKMTGGCIKNNIGVKGGGICVDEGRAELNGVKIIENNVTSNGDVMPGVLGGAIYVFDGSCELNDCTIESNYARDGAGIFNLMGVVDIIDSEVTRNVSSGDGSKGGGVFNKKEMNIENSRIIYNDSRDGGGIFNEEQLTIENCIITHNRASNKGGGVCASFNSEDAKVVYSGKNEITYNTASSGGGIYIYGKGSQLEKNTIKKAEISKNYADSIGGAIAIDGDMDKTDIIDVVMENNYSNKLGGAVYAGSSVSIEDSSIRLNTSIEGGGGVFVGDAGSLELANTSIQENISNKKGAGIYLSGGDSSKIIMNGGKIIVNMNKYIKDSSGEATDSNLTFEKIKKIIIKGKFDEKSMIGVTYYENFTDKTLTKNYGEYNEKPIYTYFFYDKLDHKVKMDDELTEVEIIKRAIPSSKGYTIRVQISVTDDADDWDDAYVLIQGKKFSGMGESQQIFKSGDIKDKLEHEPNNKGDINYDSGEVECGDTFPSKVNVYANFGGGGILRVWEADVKVWINGVNCGTTHIRRKLWGNTAKKGEADNWITIGGDKFPYPEEVDVDQKRFIDPLDPESSKVSISLVDQYGVEFKPLSEDQFDAKSVSFPDEDSFKSIDKYGLKWSFATSKDKENHNSTYKIRYKTGNSIFPWFEVPIVVRFTTALNMKVRIGNATDGYKTVFEKGGHQKDVITFSEPEPNKGYKLKKPIASGSCLLSEIDESNNYSFTFVTQDIVITFETEPIKYRIAFDSNASGVSGKMSKQSAYYDKEIVLTKNSFKSKNGYVFAGWNTKKDGSGKKYKDSDVVKNLSYTQGEIVTLYAQWEDENGRKLTASIFSNGTFGIWLVTILLIAGSVVVASKVAIKQRR